MTDGTLTSQLSTFLPPANGTNIASRFADHVLGEDEQKEALKNLLQTYLATMSDIGVQTWLMHGTLLGWWWNKKVHQSSRLF